MGLDNGIIVKNVSPDRKVLFPKTCEPLTYDNAMEIAYWRKYWGIRNDIMGKLHANGNFEIALDIEDLKAILKILRKYFNSEYYNEYADSIWDYDDAIENMIENYINIRWVIEYKEKYPDAEVYFYDSY